MDLARLKSLNSKLVSRLAFHPIFEFFIVESYDFPFPCMLYRKTSGSPRRKCELYPRTCSPTCRRWRCSSKWNNEEPFEEFLLTVACCLFVHTHRLPMLACPGWGPGGRPEDGAPRNRLPHEESHPRAGYAIPIPILVTRTYSHTHILTLPPYDQLPSPVAKMSCIDGESTATPALSFSTERSGLYGLYLTIWMNVCMYT